MQVWLTHVTTTLGGHILVRLCDQHFVVDGEITVLVLSAQRKAMVG
jgi:hypothetical protein